MAYADRERAAGLWIAPVSTIVNYMRDMRQVEVVWRETAAGYQAIVTNHNAQALEGITLSFPARVASATVGGPLRRGCRITLVVLPRLGAGMTVNVLATEAGP